MCLVLVGAGPRKGPRGAWRAVVWRAVGGRGLRVPCSGTPHKLRHVLEQAGGGRVPGPRARNRAFVRALSVLLGPGPRARTWVFPYYKG